MIPLRNQFGIKQILILTIFVAAILWIVSQLDIEERTVQSAGICLAWQVLCIHVAKVVHRLRTAGRST